MLIIACVSPRVDSAGTNIMRIAGLTLLLVSVLLSSTSVRADKREEAEALFARANSLVALGKSNNDAYSLRGHFSVVINQPLEGTLLKTVLREDVSRIEISFPGYSQVIVRNGDSRWISRNAAFTPHRVTQLVNALQLSFKVNENEKVEKVGSEIVGTTRATCARLRIKEFHRELCVDAATGLPLRKTSSMLREEVDYEAYSGVAGKQYPTRVTVAEGGKVVAEFWLDSLSMEIPDKSLFEPPQDATLWPVCAKTKPPVPLFTPNPIYPETDRRNRVQGIVVLYAVIDEQGRVHDPTVTRSLTPGLDEVAKATVQQWRFQPAMCSSTPVPVEMNIEVSFSRLLKNYS